ncbi:uncharacterized protein LOC124635724 [Helicoverpa zea]|uniref:uncharacterized protein LOC124635724 n=1 Tax=Helicoverpa zea TaxID=7113 RepID=UPI001F5A615A|nr:uncharacterized protein LOC124635724 [Helicoverpa zea]
MILKHPVITTKATNATNNKLKEEAWKAIAQEFSAVTGDMQRPEQIRLKWENLKKFARKRSAFIRQNNLKNGGGKSYIPPDEVLDRVASILGTKCNGFPAEFGGDSDEAIASRASEAIIEVFDFPPFPEVAQGSSAVVTGGDCGGDNGGGSYTPNNYIFNTPKSAMNKRRKLSEEVQRAQRDKDLGLAAYHVVFVKIRIQAELHYSTKTTLGFVLRPNIMLALSLQNRQQLKKYCAPTRVNTKQRQREALTKERQHRLATGGGPSISDAVVDPDVSMVAPALIVGIDNAIDSDLVEESSQSQIPDAVEIEHYVLDDVSQTSVISHDQATEDHIVLPDSPIPSTSQMSQPFITTIPSARKSPARSNTRTGLKNSVIEQEYKDRPVRATEKHNIEMQILKEQLREAKAKADLAELILKEKQFNRLVG